MGKDAQRIFDEGHHDEEASDRGEVPKKNTVSEKVSDPLFWCVRDSNATKTKEFNPGERSSGHIRLDRVGQ